MEKFLIDKLFELKEFAFIEIFEGSTYPWEALERLRVFFNSMEKGNIACNIPQGVILVHPEKIAIGKGTIVEPGAYIRGPCILGENCEVRHGAYVRGFVLAGNGCVIGHSTEVKSSILLEDVSAAHFNYIGDSILGNRVNLGAGVKLANVRLDRRNVQICDGEKRIPTNLKKLGAILGDGVQIGCNAVTNPGTVMGKGVFCPPCVAVKGYIENDSRIGDTR